MRKKKDEEEEIVDNTPKLTIAHLEEITMLYKRYQNLNLILKHWGAVVLNKNNEITAVKTYFEQSEFSYSKYEKFEPLKGIFYVGHGTLCFIPYNWCSDWLTKWNEYIRIKAENGNADAIEICKTYIQKKKEREEGIKPLTF